MLKFNVVIELIWTLESLSTELTGRGNVLIPVRPQMANVFALVPVTGYLWEKNNIYLSAQFITYCILHFPVLFTVNVFPQVLHICCLFANLAFKMDSTASGM